MHEMEERVNEMEERYKTIEVGSGDRIRVREGIDTVTQDFVIVKTIPYKKVTHGIPCSVLREVSFLKELNHENIIRLLNMRADTKEVTLVFQYWDCDLQSLMETSRWRTPQTRKMLLHQILSAVSYCHFHKILHRNINPKTILIDKPKKSVKLANFRISREVGVPRKAYTGMVGTLQYMAPEQLVGCKKYSYPVDIWSVGCVFGQMIKGQKLFNGDTPADVLNSIFSVLGTPNERTWPGVTKLYPSLHETVKWTPQDLAIELPDLEAYGVDLLYRMLCLDPSRRITADQALNHLYFRDL